MAADFNLSAEISVQLAKNSAIKLQKDLDNANIVVNVDTKKIKGAIRAGALAAKAELEQEIAAVVKIKVTNKEAYKKLFSPKSVSVQLKFKTSALVGQLDKTIKKVLSDAGISLDRLAEKAQNTAEKASSTNKSAANIVTGGAKNDRLKREAESREEYIKSETEGIKNLITVYSDLLQKTQNSGVKSGKFLKSAAKDIDFLLKITKSTGGIESLAEIFTGLGTTGRQGESAVRNLSYALNEMYKQRAALGRLNNKIALNEGAGFLTKDQADKQRQILRIAQNDIENYLYSYDVANPAAFKTTLANIVSETTSVIGKTLRDSERDVNDYMRLLTKLRQDQVNADFNGASPETKNAIATQIKYVEALRKSAQSNQQIRSDKGFISNVADVESLKQADRVYNSVDASLSSIARKSAKSGLNQTYGGQLTDLERELNNIRSTALAAQKAIRSGPGDKESRVKESARVGQEARENAAALIKRAEALNLIYNKLANARNAFSADNLKFPTNELDNLIVQFTKAARAGTSIDDLRASTEKGLIDSQQLAKDEAGLNRMLLALDRVSTGVSTAVKDYTNLNQKINDIESALINDVKGKKDPRKIKDDFNKGLFDVRQANAFNLAVDKTIIKLTELGDKARTQFAADIYKNQAISFDGYAKKVINSTPDITKALREIRVAGDHAIFGAKYDATGGFFGQIAEAAGLATKRLGAFLFFAQFLYKIQNAMEQALQSAVKLDVEFSKFEQIFNKSISSGEALSKQLLGLEKTVFNLAKSYGFASTEIASAGKILAQAGILGVDLAKSLESITKASLGPTFEDMGETAETTIAIMNQFNKTGSEMEAILGGISAVAAKYPVEAEGITAGVRRAGGAFATAGATIEDFTAAFTIVKQRTREADETVATSLRNIAISLQSVGIQDFIKNTIGADLLDNEGRFIGFTKSIQRIGEQVQKLGISAGDPRFAALVEGIAGKRQFTRLLPLIEDYQKLVEIKDEFAKGGDSLNKDVAVALDTIENKLIRAREAITELFTEIIRSDAVSALVTSFTFVTQTVTGLIRTLVNLKGAILGIAGLVALFPKIGVLSNLFVSQISGGLRARGYPGANNGGIPRAQGFLPGGGPNKDSFLAALTTGEYVLQRSAVDKYGVDFLDRLNAGAYNKGGLIPGFVEGGSTSNIDPFDFAKRLGIKITQTLLKTMVSSIVVGNLGAGVNGAYNKKNKAIGLNSNLSIEDQLNTGAHEIGHAVSDALSSSALKKLSKSVEKLPPSIKEATLTRMEQSGRYGARGSENFNKKTQRELQADVFKMVSQRARGSKIFDADTNLVLDEAEKIFKTAGVGFEKFNGSTIDIIKRQQDAAKTYRAAQKDTIKLRKKEAFTGGPASPTLVQDFIKSFKARASGSTYRIRKPKISQIAPAIIDSGIPLPKVLPNRLLPKKNPKGLSSILNRRQASVIPEAIYGGRVSDAPIKFNSQDTITETGILGILAASKAGTPKRRKRRNLDPLQHLKTAAFQVPKFTDDDALAAIGPFVNNGKTGSFSHSGFGSGGGSIAISSGPPNGPNNPKFLKAFDLLSSSGFKAAAAMAAVTTAAVALAGATDEQKETTIGATTAAVSGAASFFALKEVVSVLLRVLPKGITGGAVSKFFPQTSLSKLVSGASSAPKSRDEIFGAIRSANRLPIDPNFKKSRSARAITKYFGKYENFRRLSTSTGVLQSDVTSALKARRLASNAKLGINLAGPGASTASFKAAQSLVKSFNLVGIAVTSAFSAFEYLTTKVEESANIQIESAKTEAEALKAFEKKRLAIGAKSGARFAGGAISGALTGAAIGSAFTPIGTAIGAFVGAITGALLSGTSAFGALGELLSGAVKKISSGIFSAITTVGNFAFKFFDGMDTFIGFLADGLLGTNSLAKKALAQERGRIGAANLGRLAEISNKKNKDSRLSLNDPSKAADLASILAIAKSGQSKRNRSGALDNFAEEIEPQIKLEAQRVKDIISLATPLEQVGLIAAAKKNGNDLVQYFKDNGIEFDLVGLQADIAFDKMSIFFASLSSSVEKANSRLDAFDVGFEKLTDVSSRQFASDKSFDIIKSGFIPSNDSGALKALRKQISNFDKELLSVLDLETRGSATSRRFQEGLIANKDLRLDTTSSTPSVVLDKFLKDSFEKISGELGSSDLNVLFRDFIDSKGEEIDAAISATGDGGQVDVSKITGLLKEFSESLDKGAIETARRINETNKRFATEYQNLASQRLDIEQNIIELLNNNVDKIKTIFDIRNKATGLTDRQLLPTKRQQAAAIDSAKLNNVLRGTGFNAGSSAQQLGAGLIASQRRQRALQNSPVGGAAENAAIQRRIALEKEYQIKIESGLKLAASGGEIAALAMQEFEMAAERAAKSSAFLTNALLGTDDQLMSTVKGLYAQRRIEGAQNPQQAMAILANLSSSAREGLNNIINGDQDAASRFQKSLGIGSSIVGSREAKNVESITAAQQEYQNQLIKAMQDQGDDLNRNIVNLKKFYTDQFTQMQNGINMFSAVVDKVSADIKAMPSVVKHEVGGKVEVNITGAGVLTALSPALVKLINEEVTKQMSAFGGSLQKANQGLNVPTPPVISPVRREF